MKVELEKIMPREIEKRSFEIITQELRERTFKDQQEMIVKRCIHTSADFEYADNLCFSEHAVQKAMDAIKRGACIVTDTQMAKAGINKKALDMEERSIVLCRMKMSHRQQKTMEQREPRHVSTKQRSWRNQSYLQLAMPRQR